jgi:drug/metabolite transporter (DMT)-like permease
MSVTFRAHLALLFANLFFGINFSVMKYVTGSLMSPLALNLTRVLGAAFLFWLVYLFGFEKGKPFEKKHYPRLLLCTVTGVVTNQVLFTKGVSLTTPIHGSLLMMVCPVAVVFLAVWLAKEKLQKHRLLGLLLGICGAVLLIALREKVRAGENILLGDILIIINALSYALYLVLVRSLMAFYPGEQINRWMFTIGIVLIAPLGVADFSEVNWERFDESDWLSVGFIVVAVTFLAYLFNMYGIKRLGSSVTGAYIYTQPVFAAIVALATGNDRTHLGIKLISALLIMGGVYLVTLTRAPQWLKPGRFRKP